MHLTIVSDAWRPQVNGVVRTLERVAGELTAGGDAVDIIGPDRFRTDLHPDRGHPGIR